MNKMNSEARSPSPSRRMHWSADITARQWEDWMETHRVDWDKIAGLLPAIVQDIQTRQVLMQGFMNPEALQRSLESGKVTFFSRSKQRLWCKGETSSNFLHIRELALDCDCDSLLILAQPCGPTCHKGSNSCYSSPLPSTAPEELRQFGADFGQSVSLSGESLGVGWLGALERIVEQRHRSAKSGSDSPGNKSSYVQQLFASGPQRMAQKVGEEGVEVALAAMALKQAQALQRAEQGPEQQLREELAGEAGDLLFHLAVLLQACDMSLQDAIDVLEQRHRRALDKQGKLDR